MKTLTILLVAATALCAGCGDASTQTQPEEGGSDGSLVFPYVPPPPADASDDFVLIVPDLTACQVCRILYPGQCEEVCEREDGGCRREGE